MRSLDSPLRGFKTPFVFNALYDLLRTYLANNLRPAGVLDYKRGIYVGVDGSTTDSSDIVTYGISGNATMVDSDGLLKWAPHNLVTYSDDLSNVAWLKDNLSASGNTLTASSGTSAVYTAYEAISGDVDTNYTFEGSIEAGTHDFFYAGAYGNTNVWATIIIDLSSGTVSQTAVGGGGGVLVGSSITDNGDGSYNYSFTASLPSIPSTIRNYIGLAGSATGNTLDTAAGRPIWSAAGTESITCTSFNSYRSDLGGMAPVPAGRRVAGSETYVPTTSAAVYLPRENSYLYDAATSSWVNNGLFLESEAATNLVTYSQDFTDVSWAKNNVTFSGGELVASSAPNQFTYLWKTVSLTLNETYCTWGVFEAGTADRVWLLGETNGDCFGVFDLTTGTYLGRGSFTRAPDNAGVVNLDAGKFLCWISFTKTTATALEQVGFGIGDGTNPTSDGTIIPHYFQLEEGSIPTSYIPTAGSTVARAAQTAVIEPANNPLLVGGAMPTAVSLGFKGLATGASSTFADWTLDASNGLLIQSGVSSFTFTQESGGVVDTVTGGSYTSGINVPISIASRHGTTFINGAVDGTALTANLTPTALPDLTTADFLIGSTFMGHIQELPMYAVNVGDTGLVDITDD